MSAVAIAFQKQGYKVTGSDVGFYPPISTYLKESGIEFYPGWHPEKIGHPDLVVVGNVASSSNLEWQYVQKHSIPYKSYPEVLAEYFIKPNSIVCAGTYGKSTSTALLTWILKEAGMDPSYMFGALSQNNIPAAEITNSHWSIMEGDEYKTARWDNRAKFSHYSPTHLLLTSVIWDHADIYPTEVKYIEAFQGLVDALPQNGLLVVTEQAAARLQIRSDINTFTYSQNAKHDYSYNNIELSSKGLSFTIEHQSSSYHLQTHTLGTYMADNITACFALAHQIGIAPEKIITAIQSFKGMKRRLEKRFDGKITIFDDIAHSPPKASSILETLHTVYTGKIIAVFEPNTGNRYPEAVPQYDYAFKDASEVIIPRLTAIKKSLDQNIMEGQDLARVIQKTHPHTQHIEDDEKLIEHITKTAQPGDIVVFMGSHGFRGMIEKIILHYENSK